MCCAITNEALFLELLEQYFPGSGPGVTIGRGDDCAVLELPDKLVISTDLFIEDVHFRRSYFSGADTGYKSLAVNISDICAMGCTCLGFSLGLQIPVVSKSPYNVLNKAFWSDFFSGMSSLAKAHNLFLTGGDISTGPCLGVSITIFGSPRPGAQILRRGQCKAGDILIIVGPPGLARVGLHALEEKGKKARQQFPKACTAHLRPEIKTDTGQALTKIQTIHSCMDVSDGLARDIPRLIGPKLGADLSLDPEQLHPEIITYCQQKKLEPTTFAVTGGEEYHLLVAVDKKACAQTLTLEGALKIGTVSKQPGLRLNGKNFATQGFDHFDI